MAVEAQVYGADFVPNLLALFLPLSILAAIGVAAYFSDAIFGSPEDEEQRKP